MFIHCNGFIIQLRWLVAQMILNEGTHTYYVNRVQIFFFFLRLDPILRIGGLLFYSNAMELLDRDFFSPLSLAFSTISANMEPGLLSRV